MADFYKVKYKGAGDKRAKTGLFECQRYDAKAFCGHKVNKNGDYTEAKWTPEGYADEIHIITTACIIDAHIVIHDYKYGELVRAEDATQNQESFGRA